MNIYHFAKTEDRGKLGDLFEAHFRRRDLVPFFGSGFTKNCPARGGCVPSVNELKNRLVETVAEIEGYTKEERLELAKEKLSQVSEHFWQAMDHALSNGCV